MVVVAVEEDENSRKLRKWCYFRHQVNWEHKDINISEIFIDGNLTALDLEAEKYR